MTRQTKPATTAPLIVYCLPVINRPQDEPTPAANCLSRLYGTLLYGIG
jgi:hypothetical protein